MATSHVDVIELSDLDGLGDSPIALTVREMLVEPRQSEDVRLFDNHTPPPAPGNW
ncbi:hypothetical protein ACWDA3_23775 [Nonomuraea rubra]